MYLKIARTFLKNCVKLSQKLREMSQLLEYLCPLNRSFNVFSTLHSMGPRKMFA